jgi:uncharacterized protein
LFQVQVLVGPPANCVGKDRVAFNNQQGFVSQVSIQTQIDVLEGLCALDDARATLEKDLADETAQLGNKHVHVGALTGKLESVSESIRQMERVRNELVSEARQTGVQMERSREKLSRSRTEREVNASQREMEELRKLFRDREVEVQKLNALIDQAHDDSTNTQAEFERLNSELGSSAGATQTRVGELTELIAANASERDGLTKQLPPVLVRRYEAIRARRGRAVAHTTDGLCSVCHVALPPMLFQVLRRERKLDQCPHCNRIIYYKERGSEPAGPATS